MGIRRLARRPAVEGRPCRRSPGVPRRRRRPLRRASCSSPVSAVTGEGLEAVRAHLGEGRTVVFTGSSGVGKSSIVNALAGAPLLATAAIREDDGAAGTTTRRQLVRLAGGLLIDTPGLREARRAGRRRRGDGLRGRRAAPGTRAASPDCEHRSEPGCAVRAALADGTLDGGPARRLSGSSSARRNRAALATDALAPTRGAEEVDRDPPERRGAHALEVRRGRSMTRPVLTRTPGPTVRTRPGSRLGPGDVRAALDPRTSQRWRRSSST